MAAAITEPPHLAADLKALCLSTITAQWRPLAEQVARQRQALADYLAQLVHLEVTGRRERRIQDARFPMLKTLDAYIVYRPSAHYQTLLRVRSALTTLIYGVIYAKSSSPTRSNSVRRSSWVVVMTIWLFVHLSMLSPLKYSVGVRVSLDADPSSKSVSL